MLLKLMEQFTSWDGPAQSAMPGLLVSSRKRTLVPAKAAPSQPTTPKYLSAPIRFTMSDVRAWVDNDGDMNHSALTSAPVSMSQRCCCIVCEHSRENSRRGPCAHRVYGMSWRELM